MIQLRQNDLKKLVVMGDKVLIRPSKPMEKLESGLYLPQGMHKKEELFTGYIIKVGPGYPIPSMVEADESWKKSSKEVKYLPLQVKAGDLAVYLQQGVHSITFNGEEYVIAPQQAILLVVREEDFEAQE